MEIYVLRSNDEECLYDYSLFVFLTYPMNEEETTLDKFFVVIAT